MRLSDLLVFPGRELKAADAGGLSFSGPLVVFTDAATPDLVGDYFTAETYLGVLSDRGKAEYPAYFHHGLDPELKARPVGVVEAELRDDEVWATYWINERTDYEKRVADRLRKLSSKGSLGQSSGAVAHLVDRVEAKGAAHLTMWPIGEGSLTPVPCEPRTFAKAFGPAPWDRAIPLPEYAKRFAGVPTAKAESLTARLDRIHRAVYAWLDGRGWLVEAFDDAVIVDAGGVSYRVPFTDDGAAVTLAEPALWEKVERVVTYEAAKALGDLNALFRPDVSAELARLNGLFHA